MAHTELDTRKRRLIEDLLAARAPVARIAKRLSRHRSTIYREIRRNSFDDDELPELSGYYGVLAQRYAAERRQRQRKLIRMPDLLAAVVEWLKTGWSPEQIAGAVSVLRRRGLRLPRDDLPPRLLEGRPERRSRALASGAAMAAKAAPCSSAAKPRVPARPRHPQSPS